MAIATHTPGYRRMGHPRRTPIVQTLAKPRHEWVVEMETFLSGTSHIQYGDLFAVPDAPEPEKN
ncbi:MAG: hypothetical protein U0903_00055 [Planctomycetales bacterium]